MIITFYFVTGHIYHGHMMLPTDGCVSDCPCAKVLAGYSSENILDYVLFLYVCVWKSTETSTV